MPIKPTPRSLVFMLAIRRNISERGITFDDLLTEIRPLNPGWISRFQFLKMAETASRGGSSFEAMDIFNELTYDGNYISVPDLVQLFIQISRMSSFYGPQHPFREAQYHHQLQTEQRHKQIAKQGFEKLKAYVNNPANDPYRIFDDCDEDKSGDIDQTQFNKFLYASEVNQFKDMDIRRYLTSEIFKGKERIGKDEFFQLLKVRKDHLNRYQRNSQSLPKELNHSHVRKVKIPKKIVDNPEEQPEKQQTNKKAKFHITTVHQEPKKQPIIPKPQPSHQFMDSAAKQFPLAMKYYRLGMPRTDEIPYIEQLERLLKANKTFADPKNPQVEGKYVYSNELFKGNYKVVSMAASVQNRERSRLGIGQFIETKDIQQGAAGDCYFLSAIGSLASKYPQLINEKLLLEVNPAHFCVVKLYIDGQWRLIKTDDQFSVDKWNRPTYTKSHESQIWAMLIEKCFAKVYGSYNAIYSGTGDEAFRVLTGAASDYHAMDSTNKETVKKAMKDADTKGFLMTTSGSDHLRQLDKKVQDDLGLVSNHAYSVLKVEDIGNDTLVKVRNPWGHTVWKGEWSQLSNKWTQNLRKKLNVQSDPQDGSFWMAWKDYAKYYGSVHICKVNPTFVHTTLRMINHHHKSNYIEMTVTTPGKYSLFICQQFKRKWAGRQDQPKKHSPSRIILMQKPDNGPLKYIASHNQNSGQTCSIDVQLSKGTYLISAKVEWYCWREHECFLNAYGVERLKFDKVTTNREALAAKFKQDLVQSFAKVNTGKGKRQSYEGQGAPNSYCEAYFETELGVGFLKVVNKSSKNMKLTFTFKLDGIKIIPPNKSPHVFELTPNKEEAIGFLMKAKGYSYSYTQQIMIR